RRLRMMILLCRSTPPRVKHGSVFLYPLSRGFFLVFTGFHFRKEIRHCFFVKKGMLEEPVNLGKILIKILTCERFDMFYLAVYFVWIFKKFYVKSYKQPMRLPCSRNKPSCFVYGLVQFRCQRDHRRV